MAQYVLVSGQYERLMKRIKEIQEDLQIHNMYVKAPYVYFEMNINLSPVETIKQVKIKMSEDKSTWELFFQLYPVINGKIDYCPYIPMDRKKEKYTYYK